MHFYTLPQWIMIFFCYCFLGWVWESCYVSVCQRKWVNRGFLHGPWIPIYGFGAIIILLSTLPVRHNLALVYIFGLLSSTLLEYVTGAAMEQIFHTRYWDYSKHRFNVHGYICLMASLTWGVFAILLTEFIQPVMERFIFALPSLATEICTFSLTIVFMVDTTVSVETALNLKHLLARLSENADDLLEDTHRLLENFQNAIHEKSEQLDRQRKQELKRIADLLRRNPTTVSRRYQDAFAEVRARLKDGHRLKLR